MGVVVHRLVRRGALGAVRSTCILSVQASGVAKPAHANGMGAVKRQSTALGAALSVTRTCTLPSLCMGASCARRTTRIRRPGKGTPQTLNTLNKMEPTTTRPRGRLHSLVRPHWIIAPRGYADPDPPYRSRFGFVWWFWLPRIHTQQPNTMNPRVIRVIWLCFAVGLNIWGPESRMYWPNDSSAATGANGSRLPGQ